MTSKLTRVRIYVNPDFDHHSAKIVDGVPESMIVEFMYEHAEPINGQYLPSNFRRINVTPLSAKRIGMRLSQLGFDVCPGYMWPGWIDIMYVKFDPYVIGMLVDWINHDDQNPVTIDEIRGTEAIVTDCWDESYWVSVYDLSVPTPLYKVLGLKPR